jgi:Ca2+-binding EF-hand superfamily protein
MRGAQVSDAELVTTLAVAKRGLLQHDSALPEADILRILATGLGLTRKDAPFSEFRKFKLTEFVQRLRGIVIHRYSEPPEGTEEERAFKAMRSLPIEERKLLEQMFAEIDTDFSGTLTNEEVALLMERVYGAHLPEDELERLYNAFDDSNDGVVTLDEFIKAIVTVPELKFVGDMFKWKLSFGRFDADHSGFVDNQELMEMVREIYGDASEQDVQSLMAQFDDGEDGDGQVSWPEFLQVMKATHS